MLDEGRKKKPRGRGAGKVERNGKTQLGVDKVGFKASCSASHAPASGLRHACPMMLCLPQGSTQMMLSVKDTEEIGCLEGAQS